MESWSQGLRKTQNLKKCHYAGQEELTSHGGLGRRVISKEQQITCTVLLRPPPSIDSAFLPSCFLVPSLFPGAGFQRKAACWREAVHTIGRKTFPLCARTMVQVHFLRAHELL